MFISLTLPVESRLVLALGYKLSVLVSHLELGVDGVDGTNQVLCIN